jgi:hypothetical protein
MQFMYGFWKNIDILYHMCVFLYRSGVVKKILYVSPPSLMRDAKQKKSEEGCPMGI